MVQLGGSNLVIVIGGIKPKPANEEKRKELE